MASMNIWVIPLKVNIKQLKAILCNALHKELDHSYLFYFVFLDITRVYTTYFTI
jgi:hypothetical protein